MIINDGSTDDSLKVVREFYDSRIRIISQDNKGVSSARNRGIKEAKFDWIVFLDADDLWYNNHLSTLAKMINEYPGQSVFANKFIKSGEFHSKVKAKYKWFSVDI